MCMNEHYTVLLVSLRQRVQDGGLRVLVLLLPTGGAVAAADIPTLLILLLVLDGNPRTYSIIVIIRNSSIIQLPHCYCLFCC